MILDAENPIGAAFDAFGGIVQQIQVRKGQSGAFSDSVSTAKLWFWLVISTLPVSRFFTGWLPPRCPNFILKVRAP